MFFDDQKREREREWGKKIGSGGEEWDLY